MKPRVIAGIVLIVLGAFIVFRGLTYTSDRSVMKVGDLQVSAEQRRTIPTWLGGVAIVGGVLLVGADLRKRRSA
jgi:uncharacterized membrane protein